MITAYTRPFRNRVDAFGIARGYAENGDGDARRSYRVWKQIEVAGEGSDRFLDMLGTVFKNAALRITMDATPAPDTLRLSSKSCALCLHFSSHLNPSLTHPRHRFCI